MLKLKQIAEGWTNSFLNTLGLLDETTKQTAEARMGICLECPVRTNNICDVHKTRLDISGKEFKGCGCFIDKKTLCTNCVCPGGFW